MVMGTWACNKALPAMRKSSPILPTTVVDQLRIWDAERNRLKVTPGYLYQQFARQEDYLDVLNYARDSDCLVWFLEKKRMLCVTAAGHESVRQYVKRKISKQNELL